MGGATWAGKGVWVWMYTRDAMQVGECAWVGGIAWERCPVYVIGAVHVRLDQYGKAMNEICKRYGTGWGWYMGGGGMDWEECLRMLGGM